MPLFAGPSNNMEEPRRLAAQMEMLQRQLQGTERRLGAIEANIIELQQAAQTLRLLPEVEAKILVPLGGGVHLRATVSPADPLIRPVGGNTSVEGSRNDALATVEGRVAQLTESYQATSGAADRLATAIQEINQQLVDAGMV